MSKSASGQTTTFESHPHALPTLEVPSLPVVDLTAGSPFAEFELGETLGKGGMGRVVSAMQNALQRSVAVKFLNDAKGDATLLLREAIATGRLEHPNIVPVHALAKTTQGEPFFTMKRVEGTLWSDALRSSRTLLEHLEVLQHVCDAVAFAHSRGVIHRDLKPGNVLIGPFGEVYLVDWGLAASLHPDSVLPLASEASLAGTPAYLAPEAARAGRLGPWTDVFLLGATLYEVVMGRPPWVAPSVAETIALAAEQKEPSFDAHVPAELANICRRAMQGEPSERYESARAFRDAITGYLRHHEALELHHRTLTKLGELERALTAGGVPVERLFTECRFGFEQVQRAWPEFEPARAGLRRALVLMVRQELALQAPQAARALLAELVQPPAELIIEVENAERMAKERAARLIALEQQAKDLSTDAARDPKAAYLRVIAVLALVASVVTQALETFGGVRLTTRDGLVLSLVLIVLTILYFPWLLKQPDANQLQKRNAVAILGLCVLTSLCWLVAIRGDIEVHSAMLMFYVVSAAGWWTAAATVEPRGIRVGAGFALAAVLGLFFPSYAVGCGVCVGVGLLLLANTLRTSEAR